MREVHVESAVLQKGVLERHFLEICEFKGHRLRVVCLDKGTESVLLST